MTGSAIRALCVVGLFALAANGARADSVGRNESSLDLTAYNTAADFDAIAPRARLAGQFDLGPSLPDMSGHFPLTSNIALDFGDNAPSSEFFFSTPSMMSPTYGGTFFATTVDLSDHLRFSLGDSWVAPGSAADAGFQGALLRDPYDTRSANSLLAGVSLDLSSWAALGLTASQTSERDGVLGSFDPSIGKADTSALGMSARVQLGGGWMTTASFTQAITKLDLKPGLGTAPDDLHARSYGIAIAKRNLFGNDAMGVSVTRPVGGSEFDIVSGRGTNGRLSGNFLIEAQSPETDFELGYVTTFLDGSVALQTNAGYQMNFAGQTGNNAVSFLSRAKIKF
jgi:hypothetical protein